MTDVISTVQSSWATSVVVQRNIINASARDPNDTQLTVAAENAALRVLYGQVRVGPHIASVLGYNGALVILAVWGHGEVDSIVSLQIDDKPLAAGVEATHYTGTAGQTVNARMVAAFAAQTPPQTYTDALPGICYSVVTVPAGASTGFPRLNAIVKGLKVWTGASTVWSDNPAWCLADFISNTVYGMGRTVDMASAASVAADCDEVVGGSEKLRTLNLALETVQPVQSWLDTLRVYAACWVVPSAAGMKLVSDKAGSSVATYAHTAGNIASISAVKKRGVQSMPTVMTVTYTDVMATPYRNATVVVYAAGVLAGTTPRRESQVSLPGINRFSQAYREATERLNKLLLNDLSLTLGVFDDALAVDVGDIVTVSHPIGFASKQLRVIGITGEYGRYSLSLVEYDPAVYSAVVTSEPTWSDTNLPNPLSAPVSTPTGFTLSEEIYQTKDGAISSRMRCGWSDVVDTWSIRYLVTVTRSINSLGAGAIVVATDITSESSFVHGPVEDGYYYTIGVIAERENFRVKSATGSIGAIALGKTLKPADVASFSAVASVIGVQLTWSEVVDIDMKGYAIQEAPSWSVGATPLASTAQKVTTLGLGFATVGSHTYQIKALDWSGNESVNATAANITVIAPAPPSPSVVISGPNAVVSWQPVTGSYPIDHYEIRTGSSTGTLVATSYALSSTLRVSTSGAINYFVCAVDVAGNAGTAGVASINISMPLTPTTTVEVIDNNVLLRWSDASTTLPLDHYEIRKGASWAAGTLIGTLSARFSAIFESAAGVCTYWIAGVDSAGNTGTAAQASATVSQPPDFQLLYDQDSTFIGTFTNCDLDDGVIVGPVSSTETFQQHFDSRAWTTPQQQISAGYPIYIEPGLTTGSYEEVFDKGTTVASTMISLTLDSTVIAGAVTLTPTISVSNVSGTGPWTNYPGVSQVFATAFRWIKIRYDFTAAGGANLVAISRINVRMSFKLRNDAGMGNAVSTDVGGTVVPLNIDFVDVQSIQVSYQGTTNITAIYDFVDTPYPASFKVLLFNAAGARVSGPFSWSVKGV